MMQTPMIPQALSLRAEAGVREPFEWIEAAGARLAVMRRGSGLPLVCLHAIGHGARDFEPLAQRVGDSFEVIALDWPGQGRSPPDGSAPSAERYETILAGVLDQLKLDRPILLGNSIGGAAAIRLAARRPDAIRALVLCDSGGLAPVNALARILIGGHVAFFRAGETGRRWFARAFRFYYRRIVLPCEPAREQRERIIASGYEIAPILRPAWESFARPDADIRALAPKIAVPVWIVWARQDHVIPWSVCRAAARKFKMHEITLFRAGHAAFLEDPDRFAEGLKAFARKHLGDPP